MQTIELEILSSLAESVPKNGLVIEVGSLFGRSSVCLAMSVDPSVQIHCIDRFVEKCIQTHGIDDHTCRMSNWPLHGSQVNMREEFKKNTKQFSNIKMVIGTAPHNLPNYVIPDNIDMFFLDSAHTNPIDWNILSAFVPRIVEGGIISGHDYSGLFPDVIENVHRLEKILKTKAIVNQSIWHMRLPHRIASL